MPNKSLREWPGRWLTSAVLRPHMEHRDFLSAPFRVDAGGCTYVAATDSRLLIAVAVPDTDLTLLPDDRRAVVTEILTEPVEWVTVDVDALRVFTGKAEPPHHCECVICGRRRKHAIKPLRREGWVGPARVDLAYVAELLDGVPSPAVEVGAVRLPTLGEARRLHIRGEGWRAALMGLVVHDPEYHVAEPRFPLPVEVSA